MFGYSLVKSLLTTEPHNELHFPRDFVFAKVIRRKRQRTDVCCTAKKNQHLMRYKIITFIVILLSTSLAALVIHTGIESISVSKRLREYQRCLSHQEAKVDNWQSLSHPYRFLIENNNVVSELLTYQIDHRKKAFN